MCLQAFVLEHMEFEKESFPPDVLEKARLGMIEGKLALVVAVFFHFFTNRSCPGILMPNLNCFERIFP